MKTNKISKTFFSVSLLAILVCGCGKGYVGKYTNADESKFIEVQSDNQIYVLVGNDSNFGVIDQTIKSPDGKSVTLKGNLDYSGGSGSAGGVTVEPGQERHWTKPFTATVDLDKGELSFQGTLIIDSLTYHNLTCTLSKK
jgi:hypothetical protein